MHFVDNIRLHCVRQKLWQIRVFLYTVKIARRAPRYRQRIGACCARPASHVLLKENSTHYEMSIRDRRRSADPDTREAAALQAEFGTSIVIVTHDPVVARDDGYVRCFHAVDTAHPTGAATAPAAH